MTDETIFQEDELIEGEGAVEGETPAEGKGPKKVRKTGVVRVGQFNPEGDMVSGDNFALEVLSVTDKQYPFEEFGDALKFITRRIYNGENVDARIQKVHDDLVALRAVRSVLLLGKKVSQWIDEIPEDRKATKIAQAAKHAKAVREAAAKVDAQFGTVQTSADMVASRLETLAGIEYVEPTEDNPGTGDAYVEQVNTALDLLTQEIATLRAFRYTIGESLEGVAGA